MTVCEAPVDMQIRNHLSAGYGIEDIALRMNLPAGYIRFQVRKMRASGELAELYEVRK